MIWLAAVPLLFFLTLLQSTILRQLPFLDGGVDLLLLAVLCWNLLDPEQGLIWAFLAGLFADLFTGGPIGLTPIAFLAAGFLVGYLHGRLRTDSPPILMAIALAGTVIAQLSLLAMLTVFGRSIDPGFAFAYVILPTAFLNTVLSVPVYLLLRRLHRVSRPPAKTAVEE
jgi:rod shape-determining protein MreD